MGNHKSAVKRHRQSEVRREKNRQDRSNIRTTIKKAVTLAQTGKATEASETARVATKLLDKAANKGLVHKSNAKRTISRLNARIASIKTAAK